MDSRRERRVLVKYPISFEGNQGVGEGTLFNLSQGGCAIESGKFVQLGTTMTLRLYIPALKKPLKVDQAGVTWKAGQDFGVEFIRLEPQERERLEQLIADLQKGIQST